MVDLVSTAVYKSDVSGLKQATQAVNDLANAEDKLAQSTANVSKSQTNRDKSAIAVARTADTLIVRNIESEKVARQLALAETTLGRARQQGYADVDKLALVVGNLRKRHEELTEATHEHTASVGLNRMQLMEMGHVARSLADSLAAGINPIRALSMEGARIGQVFSEGQGGVGGTLKAMGAGVARLATGWLGLGAAVVGGAALAGAAIVRFQGQQDRLAMSLNGAGRAAGVDVTGLTRIANEGASRNPTLGQGGATDLAATLASTGRISSGLMPGIMDMATSYARGTEQDLPKAGAELAKAFADPGKGAEELNAKLGFLDDKTRQLIGSLERQGDLLGAQQVLLGKAADETARMADRTWTLTRAWEAFTGAIGRGANAFAQGVERQINPSLQDQLDFMLARRAASPRGPRGGPISGAAGDVAVSNMRLGIAYQQYGESRLAGGAASDKATNDLSMQIGDAVRKAIPETTRAQDLDETLKLLNDALRNPEALAKIQGGAGAVGTAAGRIANIRAYSDPLTRIGQDSALSVQAIQAQTGAERALVEARRAELEVLRSTGDAAQAAAKSMASMNDAIAKSNKEAQDALRESQDARSLTGGLDPVERALRENAIRKRDMIRESVTGPLSSLDMNMTALDSGLSPLALAMRRPSGPMSDALAAAAGMQVPAFPAPSNGRFAGMAYGKGNLSFPVGASTGGSVSIGSNAAAVARFAPGNIAVRSTAAGNISSAFGNYDQAALDSLTVDKIKIANQELERNRKLLEVRTQTIGQDTAAVQKAVAAQELWNSLQLKDSTIKQLGPARIADLTTQINKQANATVSLNQQQQRYDQLTGASDQFRQAGSGLVSTVGNDLATTMSANPRDLVNQLSIGDQAKFYGGQMSGNDVRNKVFQRQIQDALKNMLFQQGISMVQKGLFGSGNYGSPGYNPGILGGAFNGLLGGLTGSGGAAGASGAGGGGIFAGLAHLFGFADGGVMTARGPLPLRRYADGGVANSPQVAMYGEGSGPEAYVPLKNGGIPVHMKGAAGNSTVFQGGDIHFHGGVDSATIPQVQAIVAESGRRQMQELQRFAGNISAKWGQRYGS